MSLNTDNYLKARASDSQGHASAVYQESGEPFDAATIFGKIIGFDDTIKWIKSNMHSFD